MTENPLIIRIIQYSKYYLPTQEKLICEERGGGRKQNKSLRK